MVSPSVAFLPIAGIDVRALVVGLVLTTVAAYVGGASVAFLRLGHRRMQVLLSFTGGILLGVAFLHLLPHATRACGGRVDDAAPWVLAGFFLMFLLERAFHGHAHHAADPEHGPAGGCDHGPHAAHLPGTHHHHPVETGPIGRGGASWYGAFAGLAVHSLADGAALAASVIRYRPRSALRDMARALDLDPQQADRVSASLVWRSDRQQLAERLQQAGFDPSHPLPQRWLQLAQTLVGFPRHLSQHVGGFVITRGALDELVPIENAAMAGQ